MVLTPIYMCLHNLEHINLPLYPGTGRSQPIAKNSWEHWEHWEHWEQAQKCQFNHGLTIQGVFPKAFFGLGTLGTPHHYADTGLKRVSFFAGSGYFLKKKAGSAQTLTKPEIL